MKISKEVPTVGVVVGYGVTFETIFVGEIEIKKTN